MQCSYSFCLNKGSTLTTSNSFPCIMCKMTLYCSDQCRMNDWSNHKAECSALRMNASMDTSNLDMSNVGDNKKKKTKEDYEIIKDLGGGAYGKVKLVRDKEDPSNSYAMKIINKKQLVVYNSQDYLKREIKIQKKLDHPHIIKLLNYFEDKEAVYLILEYAENGSLFYYLRKKKKLTEKEAFVFFFQTCVAIDYLHKKGILHRDLKPENLLLDKQGNIKVCDFGWSAEDVGKRNTFCGTIDYMAPEMVQNKLHDYKIDIWSVGVLLFELLHGYPPFKGKTSDEKFRSILQKDLNFSSELSKDVKDLMLLILNSEPSERADFNTIFSHPWMKKHEAEFGMRMADFIYQRKKKTNSNKPILPEISTKSGTEESKASTPRTNTDQKSSPFSKLFEDMPERTRTRSKSPVAEQNRSPIHSPMNKSSFTSTPTNQGQIYPATDKNTNTSKLNQPMSPMGGNNSGISPKGNNSPISSKFIMPTNPFNNKELPTMSPREKPNNIYAAPSNQNNLSNNQPRSPKEINTNSNSPQNNYDRSGSYLEKNQSPIPTSMHIDPMLANNERKTKRTSIFGDNNNQKVDATSLITKTHSRSQSPITTPSNSKNQEHQPASPVRGTNRAEQVINDMFLAKQPTPRNNNVLDRTSHFESSINADSSIVDNSRILDALNQTVEQPEPSNKLNEFQAELKQKQKQALTSSENFPEKKEDPRMSEEDPHPMQMRKLIFDNRRKTTNDAKVVEEVRSNKFIEGTNTYVPLAKSQERANLPLGSREEDKRSKSEFNSKPLSKNEIVSQEKIKELNKKESDSRTFQKNVQASMTETRKQALPETKNISSHPAQAQQLSKEVSEQKKTSRPISPSPIREGDFFVPSSNNVNLMNDKPISYLVGRKEDLDDEFEIRESLPETKSKYRDVSPDANIFRDKDQEEPPRVTKILQTQKNREIDDLCNKIFTKNTNFHDTPAHEKSPNRNIREMNMERTSNISVNGQPRVTNIDKYLESYDIDDTEENRILSQLDHYYTTGELKTPTSREKHKNISAKDQGRDDIFPPSQESDSKKSPSFKQEITKEENQKHSKPNTLSKEAKGLRAFGFQSEKDEQDFKENILFKSKNRTEPNPTPLEMSFQVNSKSSLEDLEERSFQGDRVKHCDQVYEKPIKDNTQIVQKGQQNQSSGKKMNDNSNGQKKEIRNLQTFAKEDSVSPAKEEIKKQQSSPELIRSGKSNQNESLTKEASVDTSDIHKSIEEFFNNQKPKNRKPRFDYSHEEKPQISNRDFSGGKRTENKKPSKIVQRLLEEEKKPKKGQSVESDSEENDRKSKPNKPGKPEREVYPRNKYAPEDQREKLILEYKSRINALSNLDGSTYDDNADNDDDNDKEIRLYREKSNFQNSTNKHRREKSDPQYGYQTNKKFEDPEQARAWLNNVKPEKDLDYSFVPRNYAYNYKTLDESYKDLKKKTKQLNSYLDDVDFKDENKVSRVSWRNRAEMNDEKREEEPGLMSKLMSFLSCVGREQKVPKRKTRKDEF